MNYKFVRFLALRYIVSWKKHSAIIVAVIAGSVFLYSLTYSMLKGLEYSTLSRTLGLAVPHVKLEVSQKNYPKAVEIIKAEKEVEAYSPRIVCDALLVKDNLSKGVRLVGIYSELENRVAGITRYIINGSWNLSGDNCIVGAQLAKELDLQVGDNITVFLPSGASWSLRVRGIFETKIFELDSHLVYVGLEKLKERTSSSIKYSIALKLKNPNSAEELAEKLRKKGFSAVSWQKLAGNILKLLEVEKFYSNALIGSVLVITSLGIVNVMLMLTESRKKSIGVLKAIGATSREIFAVYFVVSLVYGVLGYVAGFAGAIAVAEALKEVSVEFLSEKITVPFILDWKLALFSLLYAVVVSSISCAYSAYKASKVNPAEVMRFE